MKYRPLRYKILFPSSALPSLIPLVISLFIRHLCLAVINQEHQARHHDQQQRQREAELEGAIGDGDAGQKWTDRLADIHNSRECAQRRTELFRVGNFRGISTGRNRGKREAEAEEQTQYDGRAYGMEKSQCTYR